MMNAQVLSWANAITGGVNGVSAASIEVDTDGNVLILGVFNGPVDLDPGPGSFMVQSPNESGQYLIKLDPDGNFIWGGSWPFIINRNVHVSNDNGILLSGWFNAGTFDIDPGPEVYNMTITEGSGFVFKLAPDGTLAWNNQYVGKSILDLAINSSGEIFCTGAGGGVDSFVMALTPEGELAWDYDFEGDISYNRPADIEVTPDGDIVISGRFNDSSIDFDPGPNELILTQGYGRFMGYLLKLTGTGELIWVRPLFYTINEYDDELLGVDPLGNIILAGRIDTIVDIDPGPGTYILEPIGTSSFLVKYTPDGDLLWGYRTGGGILNIEIDPQGIIYGTGEFIGTVDFDPSNGTDMISAGGPNGNAFVQIINSDGTHVWAGAFESSSDILNECIAVDASGNIFAAGSYSGDIDADPGAGVTTLENLTWWSTYIVKLQSLTTYIGDHLVLSEVQIAPNPAVDQIIVTTSSPLTDPASIFDLKGQLVIIKDLSSTESVIDISSLPAGEYIIKVGGSADRFVKL